MAAAKKRDTWKPEEQEEADTEVREGKLTVRNASTKYGIARSTINDYVRMKVETIRPRPGPLPVLTEDEEKELVRWIIEMAEVGYGQCRQQVCTMVKQILDKHTRLNPFNNNLPGKDWWYAFLKRHPEISLRTPQALESCRAKSCTPAGIAKW